MALDVLSDWLGSLTPGGKLSRRAWLTIEYKPKGGETKDISEDIGKYFLSLSYTDNLSGTADDATLTLEDRGHLWLDEWFPELGARLKFHLCTYAWGSLAEADKVFELGEFEVDEISAEGMPSTVQIKAVSVVSDTPLRGEKKSRTWDEISIWKCANDICYENGMELFWDCEENPNLDHVEQTDESDLEFLEKITKDAGFALKVTTEKLIIFDEAKYEKEEPTLLITKPGAWSAQKEDLHRLNKITGYTLTSKTRGVYYKCHVKYKKGKDKELIEAEFVDPNKTEGRTLFVDEQVDSIAEAETLAKKKLREANKEEFTGSFSFPGDFNLVAGLTAKLVGYGKFDGKYLITKATHDIGDKYTTSIEIRRCLDGY